MAVPARFAEVPLRRPEGSLASSDADVEVEISHWTPGRKGAEFAKRLRWPLESTIYATQRCHDIALVGTDAGMSQPITADTVIEGRYRR